MNRAAIGFLLGILAASAGWFGYTLHLKALQAVEFCGYYAGQAEFAEKLMAQAQSPSGETRLKTQRTAAAIVRTWVLYVDETHRKYPWTNVRQSSEPEYSKAVALVAQWETELRRVWKENSEQRAGRVEPGPASESQRTD